MASEEHIIDLKHVSKRFGDKTVLDDINLYIRKGEFVTLLGPSGCGKTTTLRLIGGFLAPDEGEILLDGKDISSIPPYKRPFNTVFQRYALFPHLDVYENIAFGLKLQKMPEDEIEKRVKRVLKLVSMSDYEDRDVESLSGGQQQRVAIARALVNQPKILLLDEPLAALDLKMRQDMQLELKEMHKKLGITFIYVTHDQEEALTLSDTIVVMNEGKIQQIGSPTDIYNEPENAFVADFIGESNIIDGVMLKDYAVRLDGRDFVCLDKGFAPMEPVDVVIRPEDVDIVPAEKGKLIGVVTANTFKGDYYEMIVDVCGFKWMVQATDETKIGAEVGLVIEPDAIHIMKKSKYSGMFGDYSTFSDEMDRMDAEEAMLEEVMQDEEKPEADGSEE